MTLKAPAGRYAKTGEAEAGVAIEHMASPTTTSPTDRTSVESLPRCHNDAIEFSLDILATILHPFRNSWTTIFLLWMLNMKHTVTVDANDL